MDSEIKQLRQQKITAVMLVQPSGSFDSASGEEI